LELKSGAKHHVPYWHSAVEQLSGGPCAAPPLLPPPPPPPPYLVLAQRHQKVTHNTALDGARHSNTHASTYAHANLRHMHRYTLADTHTNTWSRRLQSCMMASGTSFLHLTFSTVTENFYNLLITTSSLLFSLSFFPVEHHLNILCFNLKSTLKRNHSHEATLNMLRHTTHTQDAVKKCIASCVASSVW